MPHAAAHGAGEGVFGGQEKQFAAGTHDACQFGEAGAWIGQVFENVATHDGIEEAAGEGNIGEVGGDVVHAAGGVHAAAGALEHALGQVEAGDEGVRVGPTHDEFGITAVAAAGVENAFAAAHVEGARANEPAGQHFVARDQSGEAGQLAGEAIVVILDKLTVFAERLAGDFLGGDGTFKAAFGRFPCRFHRFESFRRVHCVLSYLEGYPFIIDVPFQHQ